ncbi:hypothetical protein SCYZ1_31 [Pseudomonas phage SCYZ1]|nr:hypothetical protein SCYZ1_31 [Pseudomonas phage SCYZ1]
MVMYENKNYKVWYHEHSGTYQVINKVSGATEEVQEIYPKALTSAHLYNDSIERFAQRRAEENTNNVVAIGTAGKEPAE